MKHTPTPWHVVNGTQIRDEMMPFDKDESCTALIATAASEHDSEFIVRACNSHDQLVAALKDAIFYADSIVERGIWGEADAKRLRDVLAAAGEQS